MKSIKTCIPSCIKLVFLVLMPMDLNALPTLDSLSPGKKLEHVRELLVSGKEESCISEINNWLVWETELGYRDTAIEIVTTLWWGQKRWKTLDSFYASSNEVAVDNSMVAFIHALSLAPEESVSFEKEHSQLPLKSRYRSGNPEVSCLVNGKKAKGILDTGAGISLVSQSFARKHGLMPLDSSITHAISASGKPVAMRAAFIARIDLGYVKFTNCVVGIVADELMEFRLFGLKMVDIDFVIGWNILQEMVMEYDMKTGHITLSDPEKTNVEHPQNLFWYSIPMLRIREQKTGMALIMELDFGGTESNTYPALFVQMPELSPNRESDSFGGAGGFSTYEALVLPSFCFLVSDQLCCLEKPRSRPNHAPYHAIKAHGVLGLRIASGGKLLLNPKKKYLVLYDLREPH